MIIILATIATQVVVQYSINQQKEDAAIINVSGRQRMLSQNISKTALKIKGKEYDLEQCQQQLDDLYNEWSKAHTYLSSEYPSKSRTFNTPAIDTLYAKLESPFQKMSLSTQRIMQLDSIALMKPNIDTLLAYEDDYLSTMDQIVQEYENEAERKVTQLRKIEYMIGAFTIIVVLLELLFLIRPLINYLSKENQRLEENVQGRTQELNESNKLLQESNKALQRANTAVNEINTELKQFAYVASHDLKQPVRNIIGFSEMIQRKVNKNGNGNTEINSYIKYIIKGANRMDSLVNAITDYTRVNPKKEVKVPVYTVEIVEEVKEILVEQIVKTNAQIHYSNLPEVKAVKATLMVVFKNLIENAIKYNQSTPPIVEITHEDLPYLHKFYIKDNGIGVEQKYQDLIFELFRRIDPEIPGGTGLGLSISKKIVNGMGGSIGLASTDQQQGSTFYFTIPK
ncbi:MAG: ATP-binding protein [Bacteroidota bacterium]